MLVSLRGPSAKYQPLLTKDDEYWDLEFALNIIAPVTLMQELVPGMVKRGRGSVVNISSISAQKPNPGHSPYAASKAALEAATKAAALELAPSGVRVLGISTKTRHPSFPDIAPLAEVGVPGYEAVSWQAMAAPAQTPKPILDTIRALGADLGVDGWLQAETMGSEGENNEQPRRHSAGNPAAAGAPCSCSICHGV